MADVNVLTNGSMGEAFSHYQGDDALSVPFGWAPWWAGPEGKNDAQSWEFQTPRYDPFDIDGDRVARLQTPFATHIGGLYQQVPAVKGEKYDFSVYGQAWSSESDDPVKVLNPADIELQVGIDPTGGTDGSSPLIIWSKPVHAVSRWRQIRFNFSAQNALITVFLRSSPKLPKKQQAVYWKDAVLSPAGRYKRSTNIVGPGDTHILLEPERPQPGSEASILVSSLFPIEAAELKLIGPKNKEMPFEKGDANQKDDRYFWRFLFTPTEEGLYDFRFNTDNGARILSQRLVRISRSVQIVPSGRPRLNYNRVYVLLPPTADETWFVAAAKGSFEGRFTVGFSADDAGGGEITDRKIIAVNPHHWPDTLTSAWYQQFYPGTQFIPVIANSPDDLEQWLRDWFYE